MHGVSVTCDFRNISTLQGTEFAKLTAAFEEELQRRGVRIVATTSAVNLVVSVSQDPTEYLAVVQIQRKESTETVIERIGPVNGPAAPEPAFRLTLHREFLFSQEGPLLDVALDSAEKHAEALGTRSLSSYELHGDQWEFASVEYLPIIRSPDRVARGLYSDAGIHSRVVYFPGEF